VPEIAELEQRLEELGGRISWPPTPQLTEGIMARLGEPSVVRRPWFQSRWAMAAAVVLLALAALVAYTPTREAIADWLNLHVLISRVSELPTPSAQPSGGLGTRLGLGYPTTLADAQAKVQWHIVVPSQLGPPDEVYIQLPPEGPPQGEVTLVYKSRPGIRTSGQTGVAVLITEASGTVDDRYFGKMIGPGSTLEEVTVKGHRGYWISGAPHTFFFTDADGQFRNETMRLASNVLIFENGSTLVRIEGDLTKAQVLAIANSLS